MPDFLPDASSATEASGPVAGHELARVMKERGVDTIFALCGGHILPFLDGCLEHGIRVVDTRHEGSATLAAEGWALATGNVGVAAITAGPGFANGVIGLADAGMWTVPLVVLAGSTGLHLTGRGAVQEAPQMAIASTVAKRSLLALEPGRVAALGSDALYLARAGRPGPVYLEVPQDVISARTPSPDTYAGRPTTFPVPAGAAADIERALDALARAEKPAILAGGGCFWSGAGAALVDFVDTTGIPVTTTSVARGLVPDRHPACVGTMVHGGGAVLTADVVLVLGSEFNANVSMGKPPLFGEPGSQTVIQVDIAAEGIGGNRAPDLAIVGDVTEVLGQLAEGWKRDPGEFTPWRKACHDLTVFVRSTWDDQIASHSGSRLHAGAVMRETVAWARDALGDGVTFVADGGDALTWGMAYMYAERPGRNLHTTTALGTLGVGLPFSVAAEVARPDERTILMVGDGAFGFTAMEIDTMVRHGLPVIVVVSNNFGWRDVSFEQDAWFGEGRHVATELAETRYDRMAQGLGAHGEHVEDLDELRPALDRALARDDAPTVIDVATDPTVISDLLRNLGTMGIQ